MNIVKLHKLIDKHFNDEELNTLCFSLNIDYEALPAKGKKAKARELIQQCQRESKLDKLLQECEESKPTGAWATIHLEQGKRDKSETVAPNSPIFGISFRRNPNFTGRRDLFTQIYKNLNVDGADIRMQALVGLGGVGKSKTAIEYAYRHATEYDLVWWIRAETEDGLVDDYIQLADKLNLPVKGNAEKIAHINIVKDWLATTSQKWLLIFDNAETPKQVSDVVPVKGNGHVLITSRDQGSWGHLAKVLPVHSFLPDEARDFLLKRTDNDDNIHADQLAELLGYFPLALEQAGSFIRQRNLPFETYIGLYQEQRAELWQREQVPEDYPETLLTTWELAFQQIKAASKPATALLNLCSFMSPDSIPLSIFVEGAMHLPEELADVVNAPFGLVDIIQTLSHYSLIERKEDSLTIHRLVQDVSRERLGAERRQQWAEIVLNLINHAFIFDEYQQDTWAKSARLMPQIPAVIAHAEKEAVAPEVVARLSQNMGEYLRHQGEFSEAQQAVEYALSIRQDVLGNEHVATAKSLSYLGELYHEQANYGQAQSCYEQALIIQNKELGKNHKDTSRSLNNLGLLLQYQGKYEDARPYLEEALTIRKQVLGELHPYTATSLNNLGGLLDDQGKYEDAKLYLEEALAIFKQALGDSHPYTATSLNNLGLLLDDQGKYEEAKLYYEEALTIRKQVLGEMHPDTASSLHNLGMLLQAQGNYIEARSYLEKALKIIEDAHGKNHPKLVTILSNLGGIMFYLRQFVLARRYLQRARNICQNTEEQYVECERAEQLLQQLPGKIGKGKNKKKKRRR